MSIARSARSRVRDVRATAAEVAAQDSEPSLFQAKARDAKRPTRDANPRNPAGNIIDYLSWHREYRGNPQHTARTRSMQLVPRYS